MLHHLRDSIRHVLAAVLVLGTLVGTTWTFSNGAITFSGAAERWVSVGGISAALEVGFIYLGWYIGQLDLRILAARRKELIAQLTAQRRDLMHWFYGIALISGTANFIFRHQQLNNAPLAAFVSAAPVVLVTLFCIKLRPLPEDYRSIGARATGRALTNMVGEAERTVLRLMRKMGRGRALSDAEMRQLRYTTSVIAIYGASDEQHAIEHTLSLAAPSAPAIESSADPWLRSEDLMGMYGISLRTAQARMLRTPGRRKVTNSNAWEAPESAVLATHGPRSVRRGAQVGAPEAQPSAAYALTSADATQPSAGPDAESQRLVSSVAS